MSLYKLWTRQKEAERTERTGTGRGELRDRVLEALRQVRDPEIPVNIVDLGLIYRLDIDSDGNAAIDMTLTAPNCPVAGSLPRQVAEVVKGLPGITSVSVNLVWEPPWTQARMSEDARLALNI